MSAHTPGRDCLRVASLRAAAEMPQAFDLPGLLRDTAQEYAQLLAACEAALPWVELAHTETAGVIRAAITKTREG